MTAAVDCLTGADWKRLVTAAADTVQEHAVELSRLDSVAGDGDHGVNVATAFEHARRAVSRNTSPTPATVLSATAASFLEEMGGAAGALFGSFFRSAAISCGDSKTTSSAQFAAAVAAGTAIVAKRGKAQAGDKTMMDALLPATEASRAAAERGFSIRDTLQFAAAAARGGAEATSTMSAAQGRARYAGEKSVGTQDPGATTVALIFEAWSATSQDLHPEGR